MAEAELLVGQPVDRTAVVVVGDTPADIEVARTARVAVVAVATGRWAATDLAASVPDALLGDLTDPAAVVGALTGAVLGS